MLGRLTTRPTGLVVDKSGKEYSTRLQTAKDPLIALTGIHQRHEIEKHVFISNRQYGYSRWESSKSYLTQA